MTVSDAAIVTADNNWRVITRIIHDKPTVYSSNERGIIDCSVYREKLMDTALLDRMRSGGRNKAWADTMVNLEARRLIHTANKLSSFHLRDGMTRMKFVQEIKEVVEQQFSAARRAKSDDECLAFIPVSASGLLQESQQYEPARTHHANRGLWR